jgi:thioesterase domain-containing protein
MSDGQESSVETLMRIWHERIPLAATMQLSVAAFDGPELVTTAPLAPNVNLHGTAFAGSLYAVCALTGWGYVWRLGRALGHDGDILLTHGEIDYRRPVGGEIVCAASADERATSGFAEALAAGQAGRCQVRCRITSAERDSVLFTGDYRMRPTDCTEKVL